MYLCCGQNKTFDYVMSGDHVYLISRQYISRVNDLSSTIKLITNSFDNLLIILSSFFKEDVSKSTDFSFSNLTSTL